MSRDEFTGAFSEAFDPYRPANQFTAAFSGAFDPTARLRDQFSPAFSPAFDRSTTSPSAFVFTLNGDGLVGVGNVLDRPTPRYFVQVVEPDGAAFELNTVRAATDDQVVCTWGFSRTGTHHFVIVDRDGAEVSERLPVVVHA